MALIPYIARIQFDFGAIACLRDELGALNIRHPLLVTDQGLRVCGLVDVVLHHIKPTAVAVFDRVPENPDLASVESALALYKQDQCDGLVALGGGSCIDAAKAVALLATHPAPLDRYEVGASGTPLITSNMLPIIAIPTTAGTGSEIGRGMGIGLLSGRKGVFISQNLIPNVAICDPELTLSLPPRLTAGTGADALSHCVETYLSPAINPPAQAIALDGVERLWRHLPRAVHNGQDREARWNVMMGALEGGMAMWRGLGPAHAVAVALDQLDLPLHHGTTVGVLMPYGLSQFAGAAPEKCARLRGAMGLPDNADLATAYANFNSEIGIPAGLASLQVPRSCANDIAHAAAASFFNLSSPRKGSVEDYRHMLSQAFDGRLTE